jgi:two-component system CheB/CheR fusion protein
VETTHAAALSVLVVDEHDDAARSTVDLLALHGFAVRVAGCGGDALGEADFNPPDVILLELRPADLDGCEVVRRIRDGVIRKRPLFVAVTTCGTGSRPSPSHWN